jgi:outer membrane receptor protein involved in Fe transport
MHMKAKNNSRGNGFLINGGGSLTALGVALFWSATPALAQDVDDDEVVEATAGQNTNEQAIVVTGSRIARTGFDTPTPVTFVGEEQIARQGSTNIGEVLNDIPAFRPQSTSSTSAIFFNNIGASTADLRGLGANRTLVLIDGRRVVPATVTGSSFAPAGTVDLNMIPTSLIRRAEVVTGGASAAYGSDAVAGVVNLILDTDLEGIRANVQYGFADAGDDDEYSVSLAGGTSFASGRGHIVFGIDYVDDAGTGDCYSRDWCSQTYNTVSNPANVDGLAKTLILPNISVALGTFNGIIIGGPLRGTEFNLDGTTFQHDYGQYYGAGIFQSGGGANRDQQLAFYEFFPLASPSERINAFGHAEYEFSDVFTGFIEGSYSHVEARTTGAQRRDIANILITRDNAFLPASVAAQMDFFGLGAFPMGKMWDDIGPARGHVERETFRVVAGFEANIDDNWSVNGYYQYGQTNYHQTGENTTINSARAFALDAVIDPGTGDPVCRAVLLGNPAAVGCQPLNPFGNGSPSAAAIAYVTGTSEQTTRLAQHVASVIMQGDLFDLWAGPLAIATGVEFRQDEASGTADPISTALDFYTSPGAPIDGELDVFEGFVEAVLPLSDNAELNGAVRFTDYSTSGTVTTWKIGADWSPLDWLRLRATRSRDIRAPNVFELFSPAQSSFQSINDPNFGGTQFLIPVLLAGNTQLQPETADTWTAGIVLQPDVGFGNLRFSADYFDITLDGAVATLGGQVIVDRCAAGAAEICSLISRNATTGELTQVRNFNLNLNTLITRGFDLEAAYSIPVSTGSVSLRVLSTIVDDLITVDSSGTSVDRAGQNGSPVSQPSGVPRYIVNAYLAYDVDPFAAQIQVRHISGGRYNNTLIGPDEDGYDPALPNSINDNRIGAFTYVNLNASYDIWSDGDRNFEIYGVVNNLFDKNPPVAPSSFGPTNNVLYDVVGRTYRVGMRLRY